MNPQGFGESLCGGVVTNQAELAEPAETADPAGSGALARFIRPVPFRVWLIEFRLA